MLAMSVLPESPIWLKWRKRHREARESQKRLLDSDDQLLDLDDESQPQGERDPLVSAFANEVGPSYIASWGPFQLELCNIAGTFIVSSDPLNVLGMDWRRRLRVTKEKICRGQSATI